MWNSRKPRIRIEKESDFIYSIYCRAWGGEEWIARCTSMSVDQEWKFKLELFNPAGEIKHTDMVDDPEEEALFRTICIWVDFRTSTILVPTADPEYGGSKTKSGGRNAKKV